jgi:adenine-specific DNA-methyltransferase
MTTANAQITDIRFDALKSKLRELFELDKSDLDFGIYRIMAAKNAEVTAFLDRQLRDVVRETLAEHGAGEADNIRADIAAARDAAIAAGFDPDDSPRVKELEARLATAGGATAAELEADIYNHLLAFFSRYYDEGDFISKPRLKGDTYAIPYSGEEVVLHWANKDQYYIKSGEWHKDYRFRVADKTVRFQLVDATQEVGNNKEPDESKRRYVLIDENPVEAAHSVLTLRFHFVAPNETQKNRAADGAVAIFGGDYAKERNPKKGDEREQFCADAEKRALEAMADEWKAVVTAAAATPAKPDRTILGKQLDHFTARNTFDYFIHKDLGGFLHRELDFYVKNEVVRLDDLDTLPADHLATLQGRVKAIRRVAGRVIDFLGTLEDFQKKLWLKKKFVLETHWLVTVDRIPERLRDLVAANEAQWREWESLGYRPADDTQDLFGGAAWGTREYLNNCDRLVVDTQFFGKSFRDEVLASEDVLRGAASFDDAAFCVLANGDNSQAIGLFRARYAGAFDCMYIDPPYNTDGGPINYKNGYRSSSWLTLIADRLAASHLMLNPSAGILCVTIDDFQQKELHSVVEQVFGPKNLAGTVAIRSNPSGRPVPSGFAQAHEYAIFATTGRDSTVALLPRSDAQAARYRERDEDGNFMWELFRKRGSASERHERPSMYYPLYLNLTTQQLRIPEMEWQVDRRTWNSLEDPTADEIALYPIDEDEVQRRWRWSAEKARANPSQFKAEQREGHWVVYYKYRPSQDGVLPTTFWGDAKYSATEHGTGVVKELFPGFNVFSYPKSIYAVEDCVSVAGMRNPRSSCIDYFAGSGTTGHAVINLNRQDGGRRRVVLVETGEHFYSVLKPRIAKVIYSPDWKDGKAQTHDKGESALVKYFAVESYEDSLNNLPVPGGELLQRQGDDETDVLVRYALDLELGPHLLDLDIFCDPWGHMIEAQLAGDDEIRRHRVDLVETFNYLLGLRVTAYGPIERYCADFERAEHDDNLGRLKLTGRLRRDADGPFVFQRVEGELNDGNDTRVLVVWRKLTDDPEQDAAVLDAWMERHRENTRERTEHREYHLIYINGPVTVPQPTAEIRTVFPIEETFKAKMFEDTDGEG